ncbi:MAG: Trp biosynthesis-associated membrane protein [Jiangellaceae bacterium]
MSARQARLELGVALGLLVTGGVLCLVSGSRVWGEGLVDDGLSVTSEQVSGRDLFPFGQAVALLGLAAVVAIPATRRGGRRVIGTVLALAGLGTVLGAYGLALELPSRVAHWLEPAPEVASVVSEASAVEGAAVTTGVGGLLIAAAGVAVAVRGPRWPGMGRRYEREPTRPASPHQTSQRTTSRDAWDALDRGDDPTAPRPPP